MTSVSMAQLQSRKFKGVNDTLAKNPEIYHRAQLGVYLRLNNSLYPYSAFAIFRRRKGHKIRLSTTIFVRSTYLCGRSSPVMNYV
jgi:hypothetical protein